MELCKKLKYTKSIGVSKYDNLSSGDQRADVPCSSVPPVRNAPVPSRSPLKSFELHDLKTLMASCTIPPSVNQIQFDPHSYAEMIPLVEYCAQHDIVIEAYTALWPLRTDPRGSIASVTETIAKKLKVEPEQVLMAWVRAKG